MLVIAWGEAAAQQSVSYQYDDLGRVIAVSYSNGATVSYAYDAAGNRTQQGSNAPTPAPAVAAVSASIPYNTTTSFTLSPSGSYTSLATVANPAHGTVSISGTTATYTPTSGYYGSDSFTYTATGPGGTSAAATVSLTVNVPAAPTVSAVSATTAYNTAKAIALSPSGVYTSLAASTPAHGAVSISGTTATYTPTSGYSGADSFTYTATGPGGTSAAATVSLTVTGAANRNPVANADYASGTSPGSLIIFPLDNDSDPDGDPLTIVSLGGNYAGNAWITGNQITLSLGQNTRIDNEPLYYTISDGKGGTATGTITLFVEPGDY